MRTPYNRYRPVRSSDSEGGVIEAYTDDPVTIWGTITVYEGETQMHVDIREDVLVGDIIEVEEN